MRAPIERILLVQSSPPFSAPMIRLELQPLGDPASFGAVGHGEQALESARALVNPGTSQPAKQIEPSDAKG